MADNDDVQEQDLLINWSDAMSVKNGQMDGDHKQLVRLINELYSAMWLDQAHTVIQTCLDSLTKYVQYHFHAEEVLMAKASFPDLKAHQAEHRKFIGTVADMEKRWQDGDTEVSEELMDLLQSWLVNHIMEMDMRYSLYVGK